MKKFLAKVFLSGRKKLKIFLLVLFLLSLYPAFVLGYTWYKVGTVEFEGGSNGPRDAYRHTLASAIVSYSLGEWAVNLVTTISESSNKVSNTMDIHNNKIGKKIGSQVNSFFEIEPTVKQAVLNGEENTKEEMRVTWLPKKNWHSRWLF